MISECSSLITLQNHTSYFIKIGLIVRLYAGGVVFFRNYLTFANLR